MRRSIATLVVIVAAVAACESEAEKTATAVVARCESGVAKFGDGAGLKPDAAALVVERCLTFFGGAANEANRKGRMGCCAYAADLPSDAAPRVIVAGLSDADRDVVLMAIAAAVKRHKNKAAQQIKGIIARDDEVLRKSAAETLAGLGTEGLDALDAAIVAGPAAVRTVALDALVDRAPPAEALRRLEALTAAAFPPEVRSAAASRLPKFGPKALPLLDRLLVDSDTKVRGAAERARAELVPTTLPVPPAVAPPGNARLVPAPAKEIKAPPPMRPPPGNAQQRPKKK